MTAPTRRASTNAARPTPLHLTRNYDWRDDARCRETDPEVFFAVGDAGPARRQNEVAKQICRTCPVSTACLDYALRTGQYTGVWGGLTDKERRGLSRHSDTAFERCLEDQEYIEDRLRQGAGVREVARELGVAYETMRRAIGFFESERAQQAGADAAGEKVAA
jgi:WhiB family redox-sensing transcriptional regulator